MDYALALNAARAAAGMTIEDVAKASGLPVSTIESICIGEYEPDVFGPIDDTLAKVFGISKEFLWTLGMEESDVEERKRPLFKALSPALTSLVKEIIRGKLE